MKSSVATAPPPLARYRDLKTYIPQFGDVVIWSGWFSSWIGVINGHDVQSDKLSIVFAGLPYLLFTLDEEEIKKSIRTLKLTQIKRARHGTFAIHQHDYNQNTSVWYV